MGGLGRGWGGADADLWEMAGLGLAGTQGQPVPSCSGQVVEQAEGHGRVPVRCHTIIQALCVA